MAGSPRPPWIYVLAGINGAGKSSIGGAMLRSKGADYFNPDEAAARILQAGLGSSQEEANSLAWREGVRRLERAIEDRENFAFETTLGGRTITALLEEAAEAGFEVLVWYIGLASAEIAAARVRSRVRAGGHDIPERTIRERYASGRLNLIRLLPKLSELRVYDNSEEADPRAGHPPRPTLLLHTAGGRVVSRCDLAEVPEWAKPIVLAAGP